MNDWLKTQPLTAQEWTQFWELWHILKLTLRVYLSCSRISEGDAQKTLGSNNWQKHESSVSKRKRRNKNRSKTQEFLFAWFLVTSSSKQADKFRGSNVATFIGLGQQSDVLPGLRQHFSQIKSCCRWYPYCCSSAPHFSSSNRTFGEVCLDFLYNAQSVDEPNRTESLEASFYSRSGAESWSARHSDFRFGGKKTNKKSLFCCYY